MEIIIAEVDYFHSFHFFDYLIDECLKNIYIYIYYCNELRMTKKNEFLRVIHRIEMSFIFEFKLLNKKK